MAIGGEGRCSQAVWQVTPGWVTVLWLQCLAKAQSAVAGLAPPDSECTAKVCLRQVCFTDWVSEASTQIIVHVLNVLNYYKVTWS